MYYCIARLAKQGWVSIISIQEPNCSYFDVLASVVFRQFRRARPRRDDNAPVAPPATPAHFFDAFRRSPITQTTPLHSPPGSSFLLFPGLKSSIRNRHCCTAFAGRPRIHHLLLIPGTYVLLYRVCRSAGHTSLGNLNTSGVKQVEGQATTVRRVLAGRGGH